MESFDDAFKRQSKLAKEWALGDYIGKCPNCNRVRLCSCPNGKSRCEKCNWVPEDNKYCEYSNDFF